VAHEQRIEDLAAGLGAATSLSFFSVQARSEAQAWNTPALNSTRSSCGDTW
jgi:hypothetical protein